MDILLDYLRDNQVAYDQPRREARLVEDTDEPYGWFVEYDYIDLDVIDASFISYSYIPGPCSRRKAHFIAFQIGFDTRERRTA